MQSTAQMYKFLDDHSYYITKNTNTLLLQIVFNTIEIHQIICLQCLITHLLNHLSITKFCRQEKLNCTD